MTIDIISYTAEQFAALTAEQLLEVKTAQLQKNRLLLKLEEEKEKEKQRLLDNGTFLSPIWALYCEKLTAEYEQEITQVREALLFYLQYSSKVDEGDGFPYLVDYSLSLDERVTIVKEYYETTYNKDWAAILEAYKLDRVAVAYLGEYYGALYDHFNAGVMAGT
ncbi:MAG: hypothetical protein IJX91_01210 [Clostridia bacterium]|nr:hypothetical protein [Clostridia bacterium]